jgi:hypothetical protein
MKKTLDENSVSTSETKDNAMNSKRLFSKTETFLFFPAIGEELFFAFLLALFTLFFTIIYIATYTL